MKKIILLLIVSMVATVANAVSLQVMAPGDATQAKQMSVRTTNGKSVVRVVGNDGKPQEFSIPSYTLGDADRALRNMIGVKFGSPRYLDILVKQAQGGSLTAEESALIAELAADSKTFDENMKQMDPVCVMPSPSGLSITSSLGGGITPCDKLSAAEIAAAPYIEKDKNTRQAVSVSDAPYRFKLSKEERSKLRRQNIDLAIKWSEKE